jgi:hypothetical protein
MPVRVSTPVRNEFFRTERQLATSRCSLRSKKKKESCICMGGGHSFCLPCDAATAASHEIQRRLLPCPRERERERSVGPNGHDALLSGPVNMHGPGTPDFSVLLFSFSFSVRWNQGQIKYCLIYTFDLPKKKEKGSSGAPDRAAAMETTLSSFSRTREKEMVGFLS